MNNCDTKKINIFEITGYGFGYLGYGLISQMISSYLVFYSTVILKLPGSLIGLVISISVVWDAFSDPVMGFISDTTTSKLGRRHLYILIGTICVTITNLMLWNISVNLSMWIKFSWILFSIILIKTSLTVFVTPYSALSAELSTDYNKRSIIQAYKTVFFLAAIFLVTAGSMFIFFKPTSAYPIGQLNPKAYQNLAITSSFIMLVSGIVAFLSTKRFIPILPQSNTTKDKFTKKEFISKIKFSLTHKNYRAIFFGYLFTNLASAIISTIGLHTFTYTFYLDNYKIGIIFGIQFSISIISQPIWAKIAEKIDKNNSVKLGLKLSIFGCLILFGFVLFREQVRMHFEYLVIYAVVIGFGSSGLFSIPLSMIADTVDQQEYEIGERNEGIYYGMLTFGYKISQAIAIIIFGITLDLIKFDPNMNVQKNSTSILLGSFLSIGCIITFIFASIAYRKYNLDEKSVRFMQFEIKKNNGKSNIQAK